MNTEMASYKGERDNQEIWNMRLLSASKKARAIKKTLLSVSAISSEMIQMPSLFAATLRSLAVFFYALFLLAPARAEVIGIDNAELVRLMEQGVPLVDIRTPGEWKSTGVIAGSRLVTYTDEKGRVDVVQWLGSIKSIAKPDQPIILICRSGKRSQDATKLLSETAGYKTVYSVNNGLMRWLSEQHPAVPATPP